MFEPFPLVNIGWHLLFVTAVAVLVKLLCRSDWICTRPSLMHLLWVLVMLKLITPSLIGLPVYDRIATNNWFQSTQSISPSVHSTNNWSAHVDSREILPQTKAEPSFENTSNQSNTPNLFLPEQTSDPSSLPVPVPVLLSTLAYFLWGVVAIAFLLRLSLQILGVVRMQRCLDRDPLLHDAALRIGRRIGCTRVPKVCVVDVAMSPSLTGCFRPIILIPKRLTVQLSQEQMEAVLAHELSHYRRGDHLTALAGLVIRSVCWWNPIAWWAYHELRCSQELCCDAMAIGKANVPTATYARSLWSVVNWLDQESVIQVRPSAAMVADAPSSRFRERILSLARSQRTTDLSARDWSVLIPIALGLVCHLGYAAPRSSPNAFQYRSSEAITPKLYAIANEWTDAPPDSKLFRDQSNDVPIARGQFWFGKMDKPILLAMLESQSDRKQILWVDVNRDQSIQASEFAQATKDASTWSIRIISSADATTECELIVQYQNEKFLIAQSCQLHGSFDLNGKMFSAAIEDRNCNGNWTDREDRLYIDLDGNGKWDAFDERFSCQESPVIHETRYTLAFQNDDLDLIPLEGTGQLQAEIHLLYSDAVIESCHAVLASTNGVHVTLDSLERSSEVPVGEYMVKQVRLRLRDERVWWMIFEADGKGTPRIKVTNGSKGTIDLLGEVTLKAEVIAGSLTSPHLAPLIVQPMCTTESGLYLVRCAVGRLGADEDSLLTGTLMTADGSMRRIDGIETTGFACGTFCPIRFPKSELSGGSASVNLQFDSGPLAGPISTTLVEKP